MCVVQASSSLVLEAKGLQCRLAADIRVFPDNRGDTRHQWRIISFLAPISILVRDVLQVVCLAATSLDNWPPQPTDFMRIASTVCDPSCADHTW